MNKIVLFRSPALQRAVSLLAIAMLLLGLGYQAPVARAQGITPFVVNTTADTVDANPGDSTCADSGGACSLRAAVMEANALPSADIIHLPAGTYTLAIANAGPEGENLAETGDLDVLSPLTVIGAGGNPDGNAAGTIIQAGTNGTNGIDKIFSINPERDTPVSFELRTVTLRYGYNHASAGLSVGQPTGNGWGGALDWNGSGTATLLIRNAYILNNTAANGGGGGVALSSDSGSGIVQIHFVGVSNNVVENGSGGAIFVGPNVWADIRTATINNNQATGIDAAAYGGGIFKLAGGADPEMIVEYVTISNNRAQGSDAMGGGIFVTGRAWVRGSTISGNSATTNGGGFAIQNSTAIQVRSNMLTVVNNRADSDNNGSGTGGGIWADNLGANPSPFLMYNSIVQGNFSGAGSVINNLSGTLVTGSTPNLTDGPADHLGALGDNGGLTYTHKPLPGSPALDAGDNSHQTGTDQRGRTRQVDSNDEGRVTTVDLGSVEVRPSIDNIPNQTTGSGVAIDVPFRVSDTTVATYTISATSNNTDLFPPGSLTLSDPVDDVYTLHLAPAAGLTGTATVTVTMQDGASIATDTFLVDVGTSLVPDLTVTKSHTGNFTQGQTGATYTILVENIGSGPTSGTVTVTDTLPTGLTATGLTGTGWNCTVGTFSCTRSDALAAGADYPPITLTVNVSNTAPASVTNTAAVAGGGDANSGNNSDSDLTTIVGLPDLTIVKSHVGNFNQGQTGAIYTITVSNDGSGPTNGVVTVTDSLPEGLSAAAMTGTGWTCTPGTLTCTRSDALAAGADYSPITLTVNVDTDAPTSVTNNASVAGGGEIVTNNNGDSDPTTIVAMPDLTITKSHSGNFTQGQNGAVYTISVSNAGSGSTSGMVTVTDTLPASMTATAMAGTGWTCPAGGLTCTRSDVLAGSGSYPPITLTVNVSNTAPASVTNSVSVSGGGDTTSANNSDTDPTTILTLPDLRITKTHTGDFFPGQTGATYTLTVTNHGGTPTNGTITVTDFVPEGLTATAIDGGATWTCTFGNLTCTRTTAINAGASAPAITLTVNVDADAPASVTNTATVSGGGEVITNNNSASNPTNILPLPVITTQPTAQTVCAGATANFTAAADDYDTVYWQVLVTGGSWANVPGAANPTLNITTTAGHHGNQYRAAFTNAAGGTIFTNAALLTVNTAPVITLQPVDKVVRFHEQALFSSLATGRPTPTVSWQSATSETGPWSPIAGENTAQYSFMVDSDTPTGQSYVRAAWTNACDVSYSDAALLDVMIERLYLPLVNR